MAQVSSVPTNLRCTASRRRLLAIIASGLAATAFAGCQSISTPDSVSTPGATPQAPRPGEAATPKAVGWGAPASSKKGGEIEVWTGWNRMLRPAMPGFEKKYPEIKVKFTDMSWGDLHQKLQAALAARSGAPDVTGLEGSYVKRMVEYGGLVDVSGLLADAKKSFAAYKVEEVTSKGKQYAVPWDIGPCAMIYRADLLKDNGIDTTPNQWTWDQCLEHGKKLKSRGVFTHAMAKTGDASLFGRLLWQAGGAYYDADKKVLIDNEKGILVMSTVKKWYDAGLFFEANFGQPPAWNALRAGTIATQYAPAWQRVEFRDNIKPSDGGFGQWRVSLLPAFAGSNVRSSNWGGSTLAIPAERKTQELAWPFIHYTMIDVEGVVATFLGGSFPALLPSLSRPEVVNQTWDVYGGQKINTIFAESASQVPTTFIRPAPFSQAQQAVAEAMPKVLDGRLTVEACMKELGQKLGEIARKYQR